MMLTLTSTTAVVLLICITFDHCQHVQGMGHNDYFVTQSAMEERLTRAEFLKVWRVPTNETIHEDACSAYILNTLRPNSYTGNDDYQMITIKLSNNYHVRPIGAYLYFNIHCASSMWGVWLLKCGQFTNLAQKNGRENWNILGDCYDVTGSGYQIDFHHPNCPEPSYRRVPCLKNENNRVTQCYCTVAAKRTDSNTEEACRNANGYLSFGKCIFTDESHQSNFGPNCKGLFSGHVCKPYPDVD